jgi:hypothetical protein
MALRKKLTKQPKRYEYFVHRIANAFRRYDKGLPRLKSPTTVELWPRVTDKRDFHELVGEFFCCSIPTKKRPQFFRWLADVMEAKTAKRKRPVDDMAKIRIAVRKAQAKHGGGIGSATHAEIQSEYDKITGDRIRLTTRAIKCAGCSFRDARKFRPKKIATASCVNTVAKIG